MPARQAGLAVALTGLLLASPIGTATTAAQAARMWGMLADLEPLTTGKRVTPPFLRLPRPEPTLRDAAIAQVRRLLGDVAYGFSRTLRNRRLFVTTNTDEKAMAPAARIGLSCQPVQG
jgi:hypothetical protein